MLTAERRESILEMMRRKKSVTVEELLQKFYISPATARRDLDRMAREGLVKRTYGGAVLMNGRSSDMPFLLRREENRTAKEKIAQTAAGLVGSGDTLFLDSSSTAACLLPFLAHLTNLTVITNAPGTALKLGEYSGIRVFCTGGRLRESSFSLIGETAVNFVTSHYTDFAFISCRGLSPEKGVTDSSEEEAEIKRQMLANSKTGVLLCDSSKFGGIFLSRICPLEKIGVFISEACPPASYKSALLSAGCRILPEN